MVWSVDPLLLIKICCKKLVELELGSVVWMIVSKCFKGLEYSPHLVDGKVSRYWGNNKGCLLPFRKKKKAV